MATNVSVVMPDWKFAGKVLVVLLAVGLASRFVPGASAVTKYFSPVKE